MEPEVSTESGAAAETTAPESQVEVSATETPSEQPQSTPVAAEQSSEKPFAKRFAALSHKEREIRQRQQEMQRREAEIQRREAEVAARASVKPKSPLEALKAAGFSYQEAMTEVLGQPIPEKPVDPVEQRFSSVEDKLKKVEEVEKRLNDWETSLKQRERDNLKTQVRAAITNTVAQDADKYEFISIHGEEGINLVFDVMEEHYVKNNQETLSFGAACDLVENWYEDRAKKLAAAKKLKSQAAVPTQAKAETPKKTSTTLTQADSTTATKPIKDINKLSREDALEEIASQIRFLD